MAGWPSAGNAAKLGSFPGHAGPEDVDRFFDLSPQDLRWVLAHRGDARLGVAVQLCSLRWLGFVPDQLAELTRPALLALCEQLESDPDDLLVYGVRVQTRSDHFAVVRERAGFLSLDQAQREILGRWLELRAIARLLELREPGDVTWLEWLRTPVDDSTPAAIRGQVQKYLHLDRLWAGEVDLSMLPPGRVRMLAAEAKRRAAREIARLPAARRQPLLLVFIVEMFVEAHGQDPLARALREVGEPALRACVEDPDRLAKPLDEQRRDAQHARHAQLAQFAPLVLGALDLKAARAYEPLLDAIRYSNGHRERAVLVDARSECCPLSGGAGSSMSAAASCGPGLSWRCGCKRATRCALAVCIAPRATATAIRRAG
ncbi:MAG: DUF4158 domain-containing protein [Solirubrobacteraceae bacterium]